jgi:hypothetical protein
MRRHTNTFIHALSASTLGLALLLSGTARSNAQLTPTVIATFQGSNGMYPTATVTINSSGDLFSTALFGGSSGTGGVWKMPSLSGSLSLTSFSASGSKGSYPLSGVTLDSAGNLWGTASGGGAFGYGDVWEIQKTAPSTILDIADFDGSNGNGPVRVTFDASGDLLGTTVFGGSANDGVVWKIAKKSIVKDRGTISVLATFHGPNGVNPWGGVTVDTSGNLWGTAEYGGFANDGVVWEITASSISSGSPWLSVIATFHGPNGSRPMAGVTVGLSGNLYGTASMGGAYGTYGDGVVWEIPAATIRSGSPWLSVLASFDQSNGLNPVAGVTIDADGNLYGTAESGGKNLQGVVWEISASTHALSVVANFDGLAHGASPEASVTIDTAGDLIGTAYYGGFMNDGEVWKIPGSTLPGGPVGPGVPGP